MQYFIHRVLINIPILLMVTVIIFVLINLAPGDPVDFYVNEEVGITREDLAHVEERFGLHEPLPLRYVRWLGAVLRGDLGFRYKNGDDVAEVLWVRLQRTLILMGAAQIMGAVVGISLGVFIGLRQYSIWDFLLTGLSFVGVSMPAFVAGIFGLYLFSVQLHWFPSGGMQTVGQETTLLDSLHHLFLPASTLAVFNLATYMRFTRFSILEVRSEDYIRTARVKGLHENVVTWRHTFRNALLPVITIMGLNIPQLVAGALFTETIYSWPGMGSLFVDAVLARDYPMVMGIMLVTAVVVLAANLATDLAYAVFDPRIRYT